MRPHYPIGTHVTRLSCVAASLLLVTSGCFSSSSGSGGGGDASDDETMEATLSSIQSNVFTPICTQCHSGAGAPEGLRLEQGQSGGHLVEVSSSQRPELNRVEPGDPDDSYLIRKLEGGPNIAGDRMPQGGPFLAQSDIDIIRQWIADGAEASTALAANEIGTATVSGGWPPNGASLSEPPGKLFLIFDGELDTTLLHSGSVILSRVDGADPSAPQMMAGTDLHITSLAPTTVVIEVPDTAWAPGQYELRVLGSGSAPVATRSGVTIDGDGDGRPGGDYVRHFEVRPTR